MTERTAATARVEERSPEASEVSCRVLFGAAVFSLMTAGAVGYDYLIFSNLVARDLIELVVKSRGIFPEQVPEVLEKARYNREQRGLVW